MMFWKRVDALLKLRNISRKELADSCDFDISNISKGITSENLPNISTAYKIACRLSVTLESLLNENKDETEKFYDYSMFQKYGNTVRELESLPLELRNPILNMIKIQSEIYLASKKKQSD